MAELSRNVSVERPAKEDPPGLCGEAADVATAQDSRGGPTT